jgi:hypothetical protein
MVTDSNKALHATVMNPTDLSLEGSAVPSLRLPVRELGRQR